MRTTVVVLVIGVVLRGHFGMDLLGLMDLINLLLEEMLVDVDSVVVWEDLLV